MTESRRDAAKGVAGCCVFVALIAFALEDATGSKMSRDALGLLMIVTASAAAAWMTPARGRGETVNPESAARNTTTREEK